MPRPDISVIFKELASTAVKRSGNGVAVLIIKDDTDQSFNVVDITDEKQINESKFTSSNLSYIKDVLKGGVTKVIVSRVDVAEVNVIETGLNQVSTKVFNWVAVADGIAADQIELSNQVKARPSLSAVVFDHAADHKNIVNFTNSKVLLVDGEITGEKFIPRILGIIAGCPLTESTTFKIIEELVSVTEPLDVDAAVDAGEFLLFNDDGDVRVARGVNSLVTLSKDLTEDMKKITIIEALSLVQKDIIKTFKNNYVGKYKNNYDNQVLFFSGVMDYFSVLVKEEILDGDFKNTVGVDIEAQRAALITIKPDASEWDDSKIKNNTYKSNVFASGKIKINDAMEDLSFNLFLN